MAKTGLGKRLSTGAGKLAADAGQAAEKAKGALPVPQDFQGPSPNPHTNLVIADVALRGSAMLARRAVERGLLGSSYAPHKAKSILKGRTFGETLLHTAIARIAVRSVPGAIIVGGGLLAKTLYDRSRGRQARVEGEEKLHDMAKDGKK